MAAKKEEIDISVIVVLFNEFDLVKTCLNSIYENEVPGMEVLLVDNSTDKTGYKKLIKKFSRLRYIQNKENIGFGRAVNVGIRHAKGKYFLILTPDTYLYKNTIEKTVRYMNEHSDIGLVSCRIYSSPKKVERTATHSYPNLLTILHYYNMVYYKILRRFFVEYHPITYSAKDHKKVLYPKYVMGAYMLIRKSAIKNNQLFDPQFRLYFEDVDLCKRLQNQGWKVVYLPVGGLFNGSGSEWKKTQITQALPEYMNSMYRFHIKHKGRLYAIIAWLLAIVSVVISIPYLFMVSIIRNILHQSSQSTELLPLWITIFKWHCTKGRNLVMGI